MLVQCKVEGLRWSVKEECYDGGAEKKEVEKMLKKSFSLNAPVFNQICNRMDVIVARISILYGSLS